MNTPSCSQGPTPDLARDRNQVFTASSCSNPLARVCGCLAWCDLERFAQWLNPPEVDLVEWRMDRFARNLSPGAMKSFCETLRLKPRLPLIVANRPVAQMGHFEGPEEIRIGMLLEAARCGAEWVDLEHDASPEDMVRLKRSGARVLMSWHDPSGTPPAKYLWAKLEKMRKSGADALKIATLAQSPGDNLRVLELIPLARKELDVDLVAFCMGPIGKWSRVASIFMGSPWTYAQMEGQAATAPGQFLAAELRALLRAMAC